MTDHGAEYLTVLAQAQADLNGLAHSSEAEIDTITRAFKSLADETNTILKQAASIVGRVESEGMGTVHSKVQSLCLTLTQFLEKRLAAATTILRTLKEQDELLTQLTRVTDRQQAVASHLQALSLFTNVEVSQLGSDGGDFQILAQDLSSFSKSVSQQTDKLANNTDSARQTIGATRFELEADLPRLRSEIARMQDDIRKTLRSIDSDLNELARIPGQFRTSAEETARQVAGVVAAIQSHDITRQQIEHVQEALGIIASKITAASSERSEELRVAYTGLTIQICQLKTIKETVVNWTSQLRRCTRVIQHLSASDVAGIGPIVLNQERELSSQLAHIEVLQQKSQDYSGKIRGTIGGLSNLLELVNEHLKQSQVIRHRLQLLTFNSLIEAHRLGHRGAVVSAIANVTKGVSAEWDLIADQSRLALAEIMNLVKETNEMMEVFSEAGSQKLRDDREQTSRALDNVRDAAAFVASEAAQMQACTEKLQTHLATCGDTGDQLDVSFSQLDSALRQIEELTRQMQTNDPGLARPHDTEEIEPLFSSFYTTEIEREVMRAALHGSALPVLQQSFAGNDVELF